ncbi:MAG: substrate-binding domain-containing protein [Acidobacteriota bacterium]|nr:substrate-binding domain-containing protein [Acidobacteriota bacterium]
MSARDSISTMGMLALLAGAAVAQGFDSMPEYKPQQQVSGVIRVAGDYHEKAMLTNWEQDFRKYQPNIVFRDNLTSTVHGIPALVFEVADLGLLGREIAPLEDLSFRRMFKYEPLEIVTATGSFDTQYEAFAIGVFVNKDNPLSQITLPQLAAIFGCGPGRNTRTWGQLGLTGEWADKPIHVLGYPTGNNIAAFFELRVLQSPPSGGPTLPNGARWNCDLKEYSNTYDANDKPVTSSDAFMMQDLGKDKYAIAYSGIHEKTAQVKTLALASRDGAPYVSFTLETIAHRTYPLGRSMYMYLNRAPGKPLDPKIAEFLRFILSRQGQDAVAKQNVFLPLTPGAVNEQLKKLE